jgi:long-chain acyl-CoA synthetase
VWETFRQFSTHTAISDGQRNYTYAQLKERSVRLVNALLSRGLEKGDRVAILMSNCIEHIELDIAIALAGLVKVPLNYRLHAKEHEYIIAHSGAKLIIGEEELLYFLESDVPSIVVEKEYEHWISFLFL